MGSFRLDACDSGHKNSVSTPSQKGDKCTYPFFASGIGVDCKSHIILSHVRGQGPRPDVDQLLSLMENMTGQFVPDQLLLDAGYDSEQNHEMLREYLGIESVIPAKIGRPTNKLPKGKWRRLMATNFNDESYGQRWQVETVMHMLKSRLGDALTARTYHARNREMGLMPLAHNLMIVRRIRGFLQAGLTPFLALHYGVARWLPPTYKSFLSIGCCNRSLR